MFGYARVSAVDQNTDTQLDALQRHGCDRIFEEKITGARPLCALFGGIDQDGTLALVVFFELLGAVKTTLGDMS
ncbi:hypothetical protein GBK04_00370 [Cytophagaceae bacterium SJW1-29]|uniref:Resolvase/invertase-type recombinase catalytic domain-containing protein n=1 Tax=Salmonirosea aquatica TaxID=2654236 RepID=A0A7C9BCY7_9BACT|nr:hypothetical protein [Cytophagaceae bacterium SJW1-29]